MGGQLILRSSAALYYETFSINLNDVFEAANSAPADMDISGNSVAEGAANGTLGGVVTAFDPDPGDTR
jgi:hypothetical protein